MRLADDPHPYVTCSDRACDRYGCIAYRDGREDAYQDGYDDGARDGYEAGLEARSGKDYLPIDLG
jgi:hypothetical protein